MTLELILVILILLPSLIYLGVASVSYFKGTQRKRGLMKATQFTTYLGLIVSMIVSVHLAYNGLLTQDLVVIKGLGLSVRLDTLSISMYAMIAIISFVIIKYSLNYLKGDPRQPIFFSRIAATIASVQLLVISGNMLMIFISWVLTSIFLHRLLIFYKDRPRAVIAARKKFIVARVADICLLSAAYLLYIQFGTGDLESISLQIKAGNYTSLELPALLLAVAAIFKSAQLPFHSWLLEVMETPTPVSALLHAGLLNAGPFLLIRMAYVIHESTWAPLLLLTIGGTTALIASIIYMTQNSIKTALAYSSMAHMGFSLMSCGLGVFGAAMLHLVAHSFYKAHSFLSSGSVIEKIKEQQYILSEKLGSYWRTAVGIGIALASYIGCSILWGIDPFTQTPLMVIGAIISMGTAHLFTALMHKKNAGQLLLSAIGMSLLINMSFFFFESSMHSILENELPQIGNPSANIIIAALVIISLYAVVIFLQMRAPFIPQNSFYQKLYIHLRNGLYMHIWFDRLVGAHRIKLRPASNLQYIERQQYEAKIAERKTIQQSTENQYA